MEACLFDRFVLFGELENFWDDPPGRVFYLPFASYQRHLEIFHDILGHGWKLVYLIDLFYLANKVFFG